MDAILRRLFGASRARARRGSGVWAAVFFVTAGVRFMRWVGRRDERPLYRTEIQPGDRFEIVARPGPR